MKKLSRKLIFFIFYVIGVYNLSQFTFIFLFVMINFALLQHFMTYFDVVASYLLALIRFCCWELDDEVDTTVMFVHWIQLAAG